MKHRYISALNNKSQLYIGMLIIYNYDIQTFVMCACYIQKHIYFIA